MMKKESSTNHNKKHKTYIIILMISILCIILSVIILVEKTQYSINHNSICSAITGSNGCETVQNSAYAKTLGIDNPIYGLIGFGLLGIFAAVSVFKPNKMLKYLISAGGLSAASIALWFLYVQTFILHTYCFFCVIVDALSLILFIISIYLIASDIKSRKHK